MYRGTVCPLGYMARDSRIMAAGARFTQSRDHFLAYPCMSFCPPFLCEEFLFLHSKSADGVIP